MIKFIYLVALILWMMGTLLLLCSLIGLFLLIADDSYDTPERCRSTWMTIGLSITNKLLE